jgi:hypothetical protein
VLTAAVMLAGTICASAFAASRDGAVSDDKAGLKDREYYRSLPVMERILAAAEDSVNEMLGISPPADERRRDDRERRRPPRRPPEDRSPPPPQRREPPPHRRHRDYDSCGTGAGVYIGMIALPAVLALTRVKPTEERRSRVRSFWARKKR